jgi:hypothetical protein
MPARIFGYNKQSVPNPTAGVSDTASPEDWLCAAFIGSNRRPAPLFFGWYLKILQYIVIFRGYGKERRNFNKG